MRSTYALNLLAILVCVPFFATSSTRAQTSPATTTRPTGPARWEKEIAAYEAADLANPPAKGGIVFTGSSTIRGWRTLAKDFPEHNVINRGFGGSQIADATHFVDRIIVPYAPRMVVLRAGGNDIHAGKSPEQVLANYQRFVEAIRAKLPDTQIVFIGLAPAPVRWDERDANKELNDLVVEWTRSTPELRLGYVDTYDTTVNPDGSPREELFVKDRLHFNAEGYKLLADRVRPMLMSPKSQRAQIDIMVIEAALNAFKVDNARLPTASEGLEPLITAPSGSTNWRGPYLKRDLLKGDPWERAYRYAYPGQQNQGSYDLWSAGEDGESGTVDDVTNWPHRGARPPTARPANAPPAK